MNKTFNKLFRKSVQISQNDQQQLQQQLNGSGGSGSAPGSPVGSLRGMGSSSTGSLGSSVGSNGSAPSSPSLGHISHSSSQSSSSLISNSSSKSQSQLIGTGLGASGSVISANQPQHNFPTLPLLDLDQIFSSYLREGDLINSYYLVHSILSKKSPNSSGNLRAETTTKSWQPFYKKNSYPCFIVLSQRNLTVIDTSTYPFTLTKRIALVELKEIIFDSTELGIFSIELHNSHTHQPISETSSLLYFSIGCEKKDLLDLISSSFDEVLRESSIFNKGSSIIKKIKMVGELDQKEKSDQKDFVNVLLDDMSILGFTAQDLWEGNADLKFWVEKIKDRIKFNSDDRFLVEFIIPDFGNGNDRKKIFRVPNNISIVDITHFLCSKLHLQDYSIYTLSTIKGTELLDKDTLADYGLGSFFENWQLCLIEKGKSRKAGLYSLEVHFPDGNEFSGRYHRIIEVDGYMSTRKLVKYIGELMDIPKPHLYTFRLDVPSKNSSGDVTSKANFTSILLDDTDYLTQCGLGSKFNKCKLKFVPKKFPKASKNSAENANVVKSILSDILDAAYDEYHERKSYKSTLVCREIVNSIVDSAFTECLRASTLAVRIASLSAASRAGIYKLLAQKEQEEINYYKMPGQSRIANEAKDHLNSLSPLLGPSTSDILLDEEDNKLRIRVPPPPPPPILGFKNFKPKSMAVSTSSSGSSSGGQSKILNPAGLQNVDMSAILGMRGKLRATNKENSSGSLETPSSPSKSALNYTLRSTKQAPKTNTPSTQETNELMLKFQKRNANINLAEAEELGDS